MGTIGAGLGGAVCAGLERSITVPYISTIDLPGPQYDCCNLYPMGYFVGCASLGSVLRPFRDSDFALADHFYGYFQKAFFKYLRDYNQTQSPGAAALQKLLRYEAMTEEEKDLFRLEAGENWIFFKLREKRSRKFLPRDYMYNLSPGEQPPGLKSCVGDERGQCFSLTSRRLFQLAAVHQCMDAVEQESCIVVEQELQLVFLYLSKMGWYCLENGFRIRLFEFFEATYVFCLYSFAQL